MLLQRNFPDSFNVHKMFWLNFCCCSYLGKDLGRVGKCWEVLGRVGKCRDGIQLRMSFIMVEEDMRKGIFDDTNDILAG